MMWMTPWILSAVLGWESVFGVRGVMGIVGVEGEEVRDVEALGEGVWVWEGGGVWE